MGKKWRGRDPGWRDRNAPRVRESQTVAVEGRERERRGKIVLSFRGEDADKVGRQIVDEGAVRGADVEKLLEELAHIGDSGTCPRCGGELELTEDGSDGSDVFACIECQSEWGMVAPASPAVGGSGGPAGDEA